MDHEERYLEAVTAGEAQVSRVLVTLLFTDIVGSTARAAEMGDRAWMKLVEAHHATVRELFTRFDGREVDCAGDGFFATFETASGAPERMNPRRWRGFIRVTGLCLRTRGQARATSLPSLGRTSRGNMSTHGRPD
jgi:class 3 adenylate cyclase